MSSWTAPGAARAVETGRVDHPRGSAAFFEPAPGVLLVEVRGYIPAEAAALAVRMRDQALRTHGRIHLFDDAWEATGYDSAARLKLTEWTKMNAGRIASHHILLRSKILAMGVSVANLALRQHLSVHVTREAFGAALDRFRASVASQPRAT